MHKARYRNLIFLITAALVALLNPPARAVDPEGCLMCHRYRGLSTLDADTGELRLFFCSTEYYAYQLGPHARLRCTDCHVRDEVTVIPHNVKTPVDCTRTCHITAQEQLERQFSHKDVMQTLDSSVHARDKLAELPFDPPLLRPGQSVCLYCHDEPLFRWPLEHTGIRRPGQVVSRCATCHAKEVPLDTQYYTYHVASRLQPARPMRQLAQVCAVCHSNSEFIAKSQSHDTVASYLHSFHGKANLLGSTNTATCLDCHARQAGSTHAMLDKDDPHSSVHPANVADTCRSARCHPGASPQMSSAAVHLPLDPHARTPEFYLAAFFIILTAVVMAVFFAIIILDLIGVIFRPRSRKEHQLIDLASRIQETSHGREMLKRLTVHQRIQHWILAITFTVLVYTGMCLKFADAPWSATMVRIVGGLSLARQMHRLCGVTMLIGFAYHITYVVVLFLMQMRKARRQGKGEGLIQMILNAPMMITLEDLRNFVRLMGYLLMLRRERPKFDKFTFIEKFEYWAVTWGCLMIGLSGLALWSSEWITQYFSGRALNFAFIIHSDEAYLAFIYIAVVHMYTVIFSPTVFPLSYGSLSGDAPAEELAEWHSGTLEQVARKLDVKIEPVPDQAEHHTRALVAHAARRVYGALLLGLTVLICFVSLRYLFTALVTRQTAPTEIVSVPTRLDAKTLQVEPYSLAHPVGKAEPLTRGPLAHFHQIPPWFQPDPTNSCATADCHPPLPHGQRIETRAFLNMHATFLDCNLCHTEHSGESVQAAWYDLRTGRRQDEPPAVLRLASFLEHADTTDTVQAQAINKWLIQLLGEALTDSNQNTQLKQWRVHLETTNPQSKLWQSIVNTMRNDIGMHLHGEYNAKLALESGSTRRTGHDGNRQAATVEYLKDKQKLSAEKKKSLLDLIHQDVSSKRVLCVRCHSKQAPLIDFKELGYSTKRIDLLQDSPTARQIQQLQEGKRFQMRDHLKMD